MLSLFFTPGFFFAGHKASSCGQVGPTLPTSAPRPSRRGSVVSQHPSRNSELLVTLQTVTDPKVETLVTNVKYWTRDVQVGDQITQPEEVAEEQC